MDTKKIETVLTTVTIDSKVDSGKIDVVVGESAKMDVVKAVNYIQSGKAEIEKAVQQGKQELDTEGQIYVDLAKDWAIKTDGTVDGSEYSSKYWAEQSASAAATVGNGTITITQDGVTKGTFTTNQSGNTTIEIDKELFVAEYGVTPFADILGAVNDGKYVICVKSAGNINVVYLYRSNTASSVSFFNCYSTGIDFCMVDDTETWDTTSTGINNASLKIQKNGSNVATFTANSSTDVTANITVPTTVAELSDSGNYVLSSSLATVATTGDYDDLDNLPNYGAGLSYSSSSLQLLDQNGNNLGSPVTIKSTPDLDGVTIDTNSDDELEAIGTVNQNTASGATAVKYDWIGTLAEYNSQNVETLHPEWVCYITDDVSGGTSVYTKTETDTAISNALDNVYTKSAVDTLISGLLANTTSTVTSNYIRLGDWLVHWGISSTFNVPASGFASQQITLSPAFANSGYTVVLNHINAGGGYANTVPQANSRTPNSFEIYCWGQGGAGVTNIAWIAIGKGA